MTATCEEQHRMMSPPELAEQLGVGSAKILHWIQTGELVAINVATDRAGRPRWAIDPLEAARFKESRASSEAPKHARRRPTAQRTGREYF